MSSEEIAPWSQADVRYAINEMYARYGLTFRDEKIRQEFLPRSWYSPNANLSSDDIEQKFTEIEKANVKLLGSFRK